MNILQKMEEGGIISHILTHEQNLIPRLLEVMSDSAVDELPYIDMEEWTMHGRLKPEIVNNVEEALKKYCTKVECDTYHVEPHYLLPIKDHANFKELKQCFKETYNAIESNDLNEVKNSLKKIKENIHKYGIDIDAINKVLTGLVKEAAKSNVEIAHYISNFQANITYPESHLQNANVSNREVEKSTNSSIRKGGVKPLQEGVEL
ncbi:hypothetical protein [Candidatus Mesenet endosymbiont of Agriotes lineatus]|uniref:hypothetical protein n=1 Tax=Candidatus Mesenet endosymbiont of Agriotes lineatus TaxID=3077948 RepID=UPI0030D3ADB8